MHKIRNYPFKLFPRNGFLPGEGMKYDGEAQAMANIKMIDTEGFGIHKV